MPGLNPYTRAFLPLLSIAQHVSTYDFPPTAIVADPSQKFEGNDGLWSTFNVRIGNPAQTVRLLISIAGQETWAVMPDGCTSNDNDPSNCEDLRGSFFQPNDSKTWQSTTEIWNNTGLYMLTNQVGDILGISASGQYGFDSIDLSWQNNTGLVVNHTVVAGIIDKSYYLGQLGVSPRSTNFTVENGNSSALTDPQPSYISLLKSNGFIPSLSYGLQVGSYSRSQTIKRAFGSLVFGGYDASRFVENKVPFAMSPDDGRELVVAIQAISTGDANLLGSSSGIYATLDTSQPHIWLPASACQAFETAFGLEWNSTVQLYLVNDTLHSSLLSRNASVIFRLANSISSAQSFEITLPYGAFDLSVGHPIVKTSQRYFPLKRAANQTQYTLGRAFMQEAYLISDYENRTFSLHQAVWSDSSSANVTPIYTVSDAPNGNGTTTNSAENTKSSLSGGTIAGIVIGAIVAIALVIVGLFLVYRHKARTKKNIGDRSSYEPMGGKAELPGNETERAELDYMNVRQEMDGDIQLNEIEAAIPLSELHGGAVKGGYKGDHTFELPGDDLIYPEMESPMPSPLPQTKRQK